MSWRVLAAVSENVVLPIGVYLLLGAIGWPPVWALVGAAAASVVVLGARYALTRELTALGVMVLARFALGVVVAVITGDARLELAKDFVITGVMGLVAAVSLLWRRPLIALIRRDLAESRDEFDRMWEICPGFRSLHGRLTVVWTIGLSVEAVVALVLIYALPLTAAVVVTSVLSPVALFGLIGWTQYSAHRWTSHDGAADLVHVLSGCRFHCPPIRVAASITGRTRRSTS